MNETRIWMSRVTWIYAILLLAVVAGPALPARAQAPYALPYTIRVFAGGGKPLTLSAPNTAACLPTSSTPTTYDDYGDGCQNTSASVVLGAGQVLGNLHDIVVDQQGNVYFLDINASSKTAVRRVDARSGVVTVVAGSLTTQSVCATATDAYGDGCLASDGLANALGLHTTFPTLRGFTVAKNGDIYLTGYSTNVVQKISQSTGLMSFIGGTLSGSGKSASGASGFGGNGGPATSAHFNGPRDLAVDDAGNIYVADTGNNEIREINATTGIINVVAGSPTATSGTTGDGGPATSALIAAPEGIDVDAAGDIFIAATNTRVIYEGGAAAAKLISLTNPGVTPVIGNIYTVAGGGSGAVSNGKYALATSVTSGNPRKLRVDAMGNIYIAENGGNVIEFVDAATGYLHVIAGTEGLSTGGAGCTPSYGSTDAYGDNCPATQATLNANAAMSVAVDGKGNIYIADSGDDLVRKVSTNRDFPTIATGTSVTQTLDIHFAPGDSLAPQTPFSITGSTDFIVGTPACTTNADNTLDCLVPVTFKPSRPGRNTASLNVTSQLNGLVLIGVEGAGTTAVVSLDPGTISNVSGSVTAPQAGVTDAAGNTYVADTGTNRVLLFAANGTSSVVAGNGTQGYSGDGGPAAAASLSSPSAVTITPSGLLYIADKGNNVVRAVNLATGVISTVAGGAKSVCGLARDTRGDGCTGAATIFSKPAGLVADLYGNVYVSDTGDNLIREISPTGYVNFVAGGAASVCSSTTLSIDSVGDNCPAAQTTFNAPTALALDASQNLYIADTGDNLIRELVATKQLVVAVAGTGVAGAGSQGGPATAAQVNAPTGVGVDAAGNVYIADTGNHAIRSVTASGTITTILGTIGTSGDGAVPGSSLTTALSSPSAVIVQNNGNLTVLDSGNNRILLDDRTGVTYNFGRTNVGFSSPTLQIEETETGSAAASLGSPLFAASGSSTYFTLTGSGSAGCAVGTTLVVGGSCALSAVFSPTNAILNQSVSATYVEPNTNTANAQPPFVALSGFAAVLTQTSAAVTLTNPGVTPQYAVPFSVTTTVTAAACNTAAPTCYPAGEVTVYVDGSSIGSSALGSGAGNSSAATLSVVSPLPVGAHTVTAVYQTDGFYASSTSPGFTVTIGPESTTSAASASPNPVAQFSALTLSASISSVSGKPTGSFSFYAGTTLLGTAGITPSTGTAVLTDQLIPASGTVNAYYFNFGLAAGTYSITAVYSGDANYSASTSAGYSLTITPLSQSFAAALVNPATDLVSNIAATYQGATTQLELVITPTNTLTGNVTFKCTNMPTNTTCGFSPVSLPFAPTPLIGTPQYTQVTFWTGVNPAVIETGFSGGWYLVGGSLMLLFGMRAKGRRLRWPILLPVLGLLLGGSVLFSGCSAGDRVAQYITPVGTYNVNVVATGANGQSITLPVTFSVAQAQ